jgi:hypothetical protein
MHASWTIIAKLQKYHGVVACLSLAIEFNRAKAMKQTDSRAYMHAIELGQKTAPLVFTDSV